MCRTWARQSEHLISWPRAQRPHWKGSSPGRLKLLLLVFSHPWAKEPGSSENGKMKLPKKKVHTEERNSEVKTQK